MRQREKRIERNEDRKPHPHSRHAAWNYFPAGIPNVLWHGTSQLWRSSQESLEWEHWLQNKTLDYQRINTAAAKSFQPCPTLCDPIHGSPPGSPIPGNFQARTLEWVAISPSKAGKWKVKVKPLSRVRLFVTPWTAAYQVPLSCTSSKQKTNKKITNPIIRKQDYHLTQPCPSEGKQTQTKATQHKLYPILCLHKPLG